MASSKVRVYELAKEYHVENKNIIERLVKGGLDVSSHSSSVYADEARKILGGAATSAADKPKKKRPSMMIRRKRDREQPKVEAQEESTPAEKIETAAVVADASVDAAPPVANATVKSVSSDISGVSDNGTRSVVVEPVDAAQAGTSSEADHVGVQVAESSDGPDVTAADLPSTDAASKDVALKTTESGTAAADATTKAIGVGEAAPNGEMPAAVKVVETKKPTGPAPAKIVRMIDRERLLERVPSNRLGVTPGPDSRGARGGAGGRSMGGVTEVRVVNDPFGRGREMVTVGRGDGRRKDGGGGAGARGRNPRGGGRKSYGEQRQRNFGPSRVRRKKSLRGGEGSISTKPMAASKRVVRMEESITVGDMSMQMGVKAMEVIRFLMGMGTMVTINQSLDQETTELVAAEFKYTVQRVGFVEDDVIDETVINEEEDNDHLTPRSPVVTVMGHVDHGKTSLLDAIRKEKVAAGEAGGITQHIGAYVVDMGESGSITFIDTPGHAAFSEMRARGANVTDIVILVVAADDGVMPQTEEAIKHAQAANVPIVVAINKMDRPDANADRVTNELASFNLVPEAWGGDTLFVPTSAINGDGLDELLDALALQAEMLDLRADENVKAQGVVLEARLDKGRGAVATILVKHGWLKRGDAVVVGQVAGKVRSMTDHLGKQLKEAGPSDVVEIIGLEGVPEAGDKFNQVDKADLARRVASHRGNKNKVAAQQLVTRQSVTELMEELTGTIAADYCLILKTDVQGTLQAACSAITALSNKEVKVRLLSKGVGGLSESDIVTAAGSGAKVFGFNVKPDAKARALAQREGVEVKQFSVIYELIDEVRLGMEALLVPETREKVVGRAEVRQVFSINKLGIVAGSRVVDGTAMRSARVRVLRNQKEVYDGRVCSLRHFKEDVRKVESGLECGVAIDGFSDPREGDNLEFYEYEKIARTLESVAAATAAAATAAAATAAAAN